MRHAKWNSKKSDSCLSPSDNRSEYFRWITWRLKVSQPNTSEIKLLKKRIFSFRKLIFVSTFWKIAAIPARRACHLRPFCRTSVDARVRFVTAVNFVSVGWQIVAADILLTTWANAPTWSLWYFSSDYSWQWMLRVFLSFHGKRFAVTTDFFVFRRHLLA